VRNYITLIGARANAASIARIRGRAALRLALVVLEHKKAIGTRLERRTI